MPEEAAASGSSREGRQAPLLAVRRRLLRRGVDGCEESVMRWREMELEVEVRGVFLILRLRLKCKDFW